MRPNMTVYLQMAPSSECVSVWLPTISWGMRRAISGTALGTVYLEQQRAGAISRMDMLQEVP